MKTFLAIVGAINVIILLIILSPLLGIAYVLLAPIILLFVILGVIIKKLCKRDEKKGGNA